MFCSLLIILYKKVKKEELDNLKAGLDYEYINSFPFPAPFEEQKYLTDDGVISMTHDSGKKRITKLLNVKEEYLNIGGDNIPLTRKAPPKRCSFQPINNNKIENNYGNVRSLHADR